MTLKATTPRGRSSPDSRYAQRVRNRAESLAEFHSTRGASVPEFSYLLSMVDNELGRQDRGVQSISHVLEHLEKMYAEFSGELTELCRSLPNPDELSRQIFCLERKMSVVFAVSAGLRGREAAAEMT